MGYKQGDPTYKDCSLLKPPQMTLWLFQILKKKMARTLLKAEEQKKKD